MATPPANRCIIANLHAQRAPCEPCNMLALHTTERGWPGHEGTVQGWLSAAHVLQSPCSRQTRNPCRLHHLEYYCCCTRRDGKSEHDCVRYMHAHAYVGPERLVPTHVGARRCVCCLHLPAMAYVRGHHTRCLLPNAHPSSRQRRALHAFAHCCKPLLPTSPMTKRPNDMHTLRYGTRYMMRILPCRANCLHSSTRNTYVRPPAPACRPLSLYVHAAAGPYYTFAYTQVGSNVLSDDSEALLSRQVSTKPPALGKNCT